MQIEIREIFDLTQWSETAVRINSYQSVGHYKIGQKLFYERKAVVLVDFFGTLDKFIHDNLVG